MCMLEPRGTLLLSRVQLVTLLVHHNDDIMDIGNKSNVCFGPNIAAIELILFRFAYNTRKHFSVYGGSWLVVDIPAG